MVCASYWASSPKVPCVRHEVNMLCDVTLSRTFLPLSLYYVTCDVITNPKF